VDYISLLSASVSFSNYCPDAYSTVNQESGIIRGLAQNIGKEK
jgi:hypothetical protein